MSLLLYCNEYYTTYSEYLAPSDYRGGTFNSTIPVGVMKLNISVPTNLNMPLEEDEYFKATLSLPVEPDNAKIGTDPAFVTITDRTGKNAATVADTVITVNIMQLLCC